ncbi:tetratricopeptide repeat protein [Actinoallomurus oryzae]|uniref:Tetratricopeptide repeat protein n=1 Tax=Actinoallomurus oryzae TaxID=502180 RepID=A0ABP8Q034_9ACTN
MVDSGTAALGRELARLRRDARLTQGAVARVIGRSVSRVSEIERGDWKKTPDRSLVQLWIDHCLSRSATSARVAERRRADVLALHAAIDTLADVDPAAQVPVANQLRPDTPSFTGRTAEIDAVRRAVAEARTGGVIAVHAVDGKPGVGKSAFVTHVAHTLAARFPDGRLFIDLHGHTPGRRPLTPLEALASLLSAVGVPGRRLPASLDDRAALWRSRMADQRFLLVLDNVAEESQVRPLLPNAPSSLVLITSRRRLARLDAVTIALDVLSPEDAALMFRRVAGRPLPPGSPVGELVELCGYLPLAIAMLGGRLRTRKAMTVEHLVGEMRDGVSRLAAMRVRHHRVAAAFELSYEALSPARRSFFHALSLHPGTDIDAYAGAALAGTPYRVSARHLEALFDENLLDEHTFGRFELHDLIAEFLRGLAADPDDRRRSLGRLLDYYQDTAAISDDRLRPIPSPATATPTYDGPLPSLGDRAAALAWMTAERANLLACLDTVDDEPSRTVTLTGAISRYLRLSGPWDVAANVQERAVAAARTLGDPAREAAALLELGGALAQHGRYDRAERTLASASVLYTASGDEQGQVAVLLEQGSALFLTGRYDGARTALHAALDRAETIGDRERTAYALVEIGTLHYLLDEYGDAERVLTEALRIHRELGNGFGASMALKNLGCTWYFTDEYDKAQQALHEAMVLSRDLGIDLTEVQCQTVLGSVLRLMGRYREAVATLTDARTKARRLADRSLEAEILIDMGAALTRLGEHEEAERAFGESLARYEEIGEELGTACALKELADLLVAAGRLEEARRRLAGARDRYERLGERLGLVATDNSLGRLEAAAGDAPASAVAHERALGLVREFGSPLEEAAALAGIGVAARARGDLRTARDRTREALAIYRRIGAAEANEAESLLTELGSAP